MAASFLLLVTCTGFPPEQSLPLPLSNGFHEKASLVKVNVMTKAPTIQDETPLPRFHSHSL